MRKIRMGSVATMALLGVASVFANPVLAASATTATTAQTAQTEGAAMPEMRYRSIEGADAGSITLPNEMTTEEIIGANVYDANNESIGEVVDLLLAEDGQVNRVLVDVGGFLGMGVHTVALPVDETAVASVDGEQRITVAATKEELEAMPAYEQDGNVNWVVND